PAVLDCVILLPLPSSVLFHSGFLRHRHPLSFPARRSSDLPAVEPVAAPALDTLPLYEAVVADSSSLVGRTLREAEFREHYGGVVLAIQRADDTLQGPLGRTPLRPGDLLLVEARNGFDRTWNARRDEFYLVAARREEQ